MSRIEIPMDEYQGMKNKIESLEKTIVEKNKELEEYKDKFFNAQDILENVYHSDFFSRIFRWEKMFENVNFDE